MGGLSRTDVGKFKDAEEEGAEKAAVLARSMPLRSSFALFTSMVGKVPQRKTLSIKGLTKDAVQGVPCCSKQLS